MIMKLALVKYGDNGETRLSGTTAVMVTYVGYFGSHCDSRHIETTSSALVFCLTKV